MNFVKLSRFKIQAVMITKIFHQDLTNRFAYQLRDLMGFTGKKIERKLKEMPLVLVEVAKNINIAV